MTTITPEIRQAVEQAGDAPVRLEDPETRAVYVVLKADVYEQMRLLLENEEDRRDQQAWARLARKARDQWAAENPY